MRAMYSRSFSARFGFTENCSSSAGQAKPTVSDEPTISATASAGIRRSRSTMVMKNMAATKMEITSSTICAGSTALISVYDAPVKVSCERVSSP